MVSQMSIRLWWLKHTTEQYEHYFLVSRPLPPNLANIETDHGPLGDLLTPGTFFILSPFDEKNITIFQGVGRGSEQIKHRVYLSQELKPKDYGNIFTETEVDIGDIP